MSVPYVVCEGIGRTYGAGMSATVALQPTHCDVHAGDRIAIVGPSGSGKSTLLHLMAGLDTPTVGEISWPGLGARAALRPGPVAMVFQGPSLMPALTVVENVALPALLAGGRMTDAHAAAEEGLALLGIAELADKLPEEVSGGQAQRVAVARALTGVPRLLLADEPTGQLDRANATAVIDALLAAAARVEAALVLSTHDPAVAARLPQRWQMDGGRLRSEVAR